MTFTRKQYINKECTHDEYYAQFVTEPMLKAVTSAFGKDRLSAALAADKNLNNIPLERWDRLAYSFGYGFYRPEPPTIDGLPRLRTLSDYVCALKNAARQITKEKQDA